MRFKRGVACSHCGTLYGYDLKRQIVGSVKKKEGGLPKAGKRAIRRAEMEARETALAKSCPSCGRLPSEAYATEFTFESVASAATEKKDDAE